MKLPFILIVFSSLFIVSSCEVKLKNEWESLPKDQISSQNFDSLKKIINDQDKNIYSVGTRSNMVQNERSGLMTKTSAAGKLIWSQSFQCGYSSVEQTMADIHKEYLVVVTNKCLLSFGQDGKLNWRKDFENPIEINDLKILNGHIYVLGNSFQVFTLNGDLIYREDFDKSFWSIHSYAQQILIVGSGKVISYSPIENATKKLIFLDDLSPPGQLTFLQHNFYIACFFDSLEDQVVLVAFDLSGRVIWKKKYDNVDRNSFDLPAAPQIQSIENKLILILSKHGHREIVLINPSNGQILKNIKNNNGMIKTSYIVEKKALIIFGENDLEVYDKNLSLVSNYKIAYTTLLTAGDFIIDQQKLYLATSVLINGSFRFYLAKLSPKQSESKINQ